MIPRLPLGACRRGLALAGVLTLAVPNRAQDPRGGTEVWDDGPLLGVPLACVVNGAGLTPGPRRLHSKKAGVTATTARTSPPTGPDFSFERIFRDRLTGSVPTNFRIDAFSVGLDVIWIDEVTGILNPSEPAWTGILIAFEPEDPMARTSSGVLRREDSNPDAAGTDVFDLPINLPGTARRLYREIDGTELGFSDGTSASAEGQIVALDLHLTAWDLDPAIRSTLPAHPRVFFSVPSSATSEVPAAWWTRGLHSGATVFYSEWTGTDWSEPAVYATPSDLLLRPTDDVDALAVEWHNGDDAEIVFSTQVVPGRDQLLYVHLGTDGDPQPVMVSGSTSATAAAGAGSTNVAAICFYDPSISGQGCSVTQRWSYVLGTPVRPSPLFPLRLSNSTIRGCTAAGAPALVCSGAGWPASGRTAGFGVLFLTGGGESTPPIEFGFPHWPVGLPFVRPASGFGGDPMAIALPLPDFLYSAMPDPNLCAYLWTFWFAFDATLDNFAISRPVRIRL
ncbi:MAG: hypothetical protein R3F56_12495 [Planctomycetota bacterium]